MTIEYSKTLMDISESPPKIYKYNDLRKGDVFLIIFDGGELDSVFRMRVEGGSSLSLGHPARSEHSQIGDILNREELMQYQMYKVNLIVEAYYQNEKPLGIKK